MLNTCYLVKGKIGLRTLGFKTFCGISYFAVKCRHMVKFDYLQVWQLALFTDNWVLFKVEEWQREDNKTTISTSPITTYEGNLGLWSGCIHHNSPAANLSISKKLDFLATLQKMVVH